MNLLASTSTTLVEFPAYSIVNVRIFYRSSILPSPLQHSFEYCDREAKTACSGWWVHVHVEDPTNRLVCLIRL